MTCHALPSCIVSINIDITSTIGLMQQSRRWPLIHQASGMLPPQYVINSLISTILTLTSYYTTDNTNTITMILLGLRTNLVGICAQIFFEDIIFFRLFSVSTGTHQQPCSCLCKSSANQPCILLRCCTTLLGRLWKRYSRIHTKPYQLYCCAGPESGPSTENSSVFPCASSSFVIINMDPS